MKNIRNIDDLTDEQRESILSNLEKQLDGIEQTAKIPTVANTAKKAATENGEKAVRELTDRESAIQTRIDNIKKNLQRISLIMHLMHLNKICNTEKIQ